VGIDGGTVAVSGVNVALVGELLEWPVAAATEEVVCFGCGKSGWTAEREMLESRFGGFLAVEDGVAVIHLGTPEAVVGRAVTDNVLAGDVFAVVVQGGVEGVLSGDLSDEPRRHVGAGAEFVFRDDLTMFSEVFTNGALIRFSRVVRTVGSGVGHTLDPTSTLVKVTISPSSNF
jgi:hypothetical protein